MPEKMIPSLVLGNLRRAQAFDASLKSTNRIDAIAAEYTNAILYQRDQGKRVRTIDEMIGDLLKETDKSILPQAERLGTQNASEILAKTPAAKGVDLADARERGAAALRNKLKERQRKKIIETDIKANGAKLDADLNRFWQDPSEGKNITEKTKRLNKLHREQEAKRKEWETDLKDFHNGERKTRPSPPKLENLSRFTSESKKDIRVQARRFGTDTEIAVFAGAGHKLFVWIAPNGISACPDCLNRRNVVLTIEQWEEVGRPGSGKTVCGVHCFCMLLPKETVSVAPSLITSRESVERGPLTSPELLAFLNANRL